MPRFLFALMLFSLVMQFCQCSSKPSCCLIRPPEIHLTGEKTVLERQIIGEYDELEQDAWAVATVKSSLQRRGAVPAVSAGDPELFKAMKVREFHEDKLRKLKNSGYVGETRNGLVGLVDSNRVILKGKEKEQVASIIKNENSARKTIFRIVLTRRLKRAPSEKESRAFSLAFAREQRALAHKNDWIEDSSGKWEKK
jgi:hypothetical protein